jgi:hypothetical protein
MIKKSLLKAIQLQKDYEELAKNEDLKLCGIGAGTGVHLNISSKKFYELAEEMGAKVKKETRDSKSYPCELNFIIDNVNIFTLIG